MTVARRDGNEEPWRKWIRDNPNLDSIHASLSLADSDLWIHRYRMQTDRRGTREIQHIMLVEVKTFGAPMPAAQADTLRLVNAVLRLADGHRFPLRTPDGHATRLVRSWGIHVLRLSADRPDTSETMTWDKRSIDIPTLEAVLRFELKPTTLRLHSDRRHHAPSVAEKLQLRLP